MSRGEATELIGKLKRYETEEEEKEKEARRPRAAGSDVPLEPPDYL
jgi:hypothetical protein